MLGDQLCRLQTQLSRLAERMHGPQDWSSAREIEPELPPDFPLQQAVRQALEDTFVRAMRSPPGSLDASG